MGYIYKITNKNSGAVYIGQTSRDYKIRWNEHLNYLGQDYDPQKATLLHRALNKYGKDNFDFEVIEETDDLNGREQYWIEYYHCYIYDPLYEKGYNMTPGGKGCAQPSPYEQQIIQLWEEGYSVGEIIDKVNCSRETARNILNKFNIDISLRLRRGCKYKSRPIHQYTLDGIYIQEFPSLAEAARVIPKVTTSSLVNACRGEISQTGRFIWVYAEEDTPELIKEKVKKAKEKTHHRDRSVEQYSLNGDYIKTYNTIKEASDKLGFKSTSSISNVCTGRAKTAGGYIWKYKD